jgi:hypothetical protein
VAYKDTDEGRFERAILEGLFKRVADADPERFAYFWNKGEAVSDHGRGKAPLGLLGMDRNWVRREVTDALPLLPSMYNEHRKRLGLHEETVEYYERKHVLDRMGYIRRIPTEFSGGAPNSSGVPRPVLNKVVTYSVTEMRDATRSFDRTWQKRLVAEIGAYCRKCRKFIDIHLPPEHPDALHGDHGLAWSHGGWTVRANYLPTHNKCNREWGAAPLYQKLDDAARAVMHKLEKVAGLQFESETTIASFLNGELDLEWQIVQVGSSATLRVVLPAQQLVVPRTPVLLDANGNPYISA